MRQGSQSGIVGLHMSARCHKRANWILLQAGREEACRWVMPFMQPTIGPHEKEAGRWADVNVSMQHRGSTLWFSNLAVRYVGDSAGQRVFVMRD